MNAKRAYGYHLLQVRQTWPGLHVRHSAVGIHFQRFVSERFDVVNSLSAHTACDYCDQYVTST